MDTSAKINKIRDAITNSVGDKSTNKAGVVTCPVCGGVVSYVIGYNGHIRASCSGDCRTSWME